MSLGRDFERAREVVRRSGVAADLEKRLRAGAGGAPRSLQVEVLLAACVVVHGRKYKSATLVQIHKLLAKDLPARVQLDAQTRWFDRGVTLHVTARQVRYLFKRICSLLDYSPHTAQHRRTGEPLSSAERAIREDDFVVKMNRLIEASRPQDVPASSTIAVDGTSVRSNGRPCGTLPSAKKEPDYRTDSSAFFRQHSDSHDPDGRWDHQTKTHQNGTNKCFGYNCVASVGVYAPSSPFRQLHLFQSATVIPNGYMKAAPVLRLLDSYISGGNTVSRILVDRGFSDWVPDTWANELPKRGIEQVIDIHANDRGARLDLETGILVADSGAYAPWTPPELLNIRRPPRFKVTKPGPRAKASKIAAYKVNLQALEIFATAQAELGRYALKPNTSIRPDGSRQYKAPTYNRHMATAAQRRTKVFKKPTMILAASVNPKLRQRHRWGSAAWIEDFSPRTFIEGAFGLIKSRDGEGVRRGWIRVVGIVPTGMMLIFAMVHHNIRVARSWARRTGFKSTDMLLQHLGKKHGQATVQNTVVPDTGMDQRLTA